MEFERLRLDRSLLDFNDSTSLPQNFEAEIILVDLLQRNSFPKAYMCPSLSLSNNSFDNHIRKKFKGDGTKDFMFLGEVQEFKRGSKTLFLKNGTCIFYTHLVIVSENSLHHSLEKQEEGFYRALQSLQEALSVSSRIEVKEKIKGSVQESIPKLRAMVKMESVKDNNESLAVIQNSGKQKNIREPQNRHFELQL